jgi:hypothetical protein
LLFGAVLASVLLSLLLAQLNLAIRRQFTISATLAHLFRFVLGFEGAMG